MVRGYENADSREVLYRWRYIEKLYSERIVPLYAYRCGKCGREIVASGYPAPVVVCCGEPAEVSPARTCHVRMERHD